MSLSWRLYWNLVSQKKPWMNKLLKESARNASNRGFVFEFDEFRQLITTEWSPDCGIDFIRWVSTRFPAVTLLLGALRSEQLDRFRGAGLQGIDFNRENKDNHHPTVAKLVTQSPRTMMIKASTGPWRRRATPE